MSSNSSERTSLSSHSDWGMHDKVNKKKRCYSSMDNECYIDDNAEDIGDEVDVLQSPQRKKHKSLVNGTGFSFNTGSSLQSDGTQSRLSQSPSNKKRRSSIMSLVSPTSVQKSRSGGLWNTSNGSNISQNKINNNITYRNTEKDKKKDKKKEVVRMRVNYPQINVSKQDQEFISFSVIKSPKLSLSNNRKLANILISSYIHQIVSKKLNVPTEIKSVCSNFYGLSYFLDSSIINKTEAKILTNLLLSKLNIIGNKTANNIQFDLLYRHSRSILDNKQYDKVCNGKTNIIVLIKSNYNAIFGGYTASFIYNDNKKADYNKDTNSFLFSINNSVQNSNIFPIKRQYSNYATYNNPNGPIFGMGFDIYLNGNNSFCKPQSYQIINASKLCGKDIRKINPNFIIHTHYFKIIDYEIYQIKLI